MKKINTKRGFSLVELAITIFIVVILYFASGFLGNDSKERDTAKVAFLAKYPEVSRIVVSKVRGQDNQFKAHLWVKEGYKSATFPVGRRTHNVLVNMDGEILILNDKPFFEKDR